MAEHEWNFAKAGAACHVCKSAFVAEQRYYSVLIQTADPAGAAAIVRQDYCVPCFETQRPENMFYFWKAAQPNADGDTLKQQRPRIDVEYVFEFFRRLEGDSAPQRIAFRYILALMLSRKKMLVFENKIKDAAGNELHIFREKRGGQAHQVIEPVLSDDEVASVSTELGVLLGLAPPAPKTSPQPAESAPGAESITGDPVAASAASSTNIEENVTGRTTE